MNRLRIQRPLAGGFDAWQKKGLPISTTRILQ
jgi:hypothetical protein